MLGFLIQRHLLTNLEIEKDYQNEPKFNSIFSKNTLAKVKDREYVVNLDEYKSIETHWIDLYVNCHKGTLFDSFEVEHFRKEIKIRTKQKYHHKYL